MAQDVDVPHEIDGIIRQYFAIFDLLFDAILFRVVHCRYENERSAVLIVDNI